MTNEQLRRPARPALPARPRSPRSRSTASDPPYYRPPEDSDEYQYMMERRRALDGALPRRVVRTRRPLELPADATCSPSSTPARATRRCRRRWRSPGCCATWRATRTSGPRVVPIIPDEARTFGMDALFREFKIYASQGQQYEPVDARPAAVLHRGEGRPDPRGGHHRGGRDVELHRRGHRVRAPRRADGAVLHLLFDVRLPAGRRPHLGRGRRARPRLPARRDRRTHDAARRRACSTRTATATLLASTVPPCQAYDPAFAYEMATIIQARHAPHVRRPQPRGRASTTSRSTTRTTRCRPCPTATSTTASCAGLYKWADAPDGPAAAGHGPVLRLGARRGARGAATELAEHFDVGAELWSATSYKALREEALIDRTLEPAASVASPAHAARHRAARRRGGPDRRRHRLHEGRARPDRALVPADDRSSRSAPTGSAAPTPASRCAATSRSTPAKRRRRCARLSRRNRRREARDRARRDRSLQHRPRGDRPRRAVSVPNRLR